jgi:hypothetical protein
MTNPLLQSTLQIQAPIFNLIKDEDFKLALSNGLAVHDKKLWRLPTIRRSLLFKIQYLAFETQESTLKEPAVFLQSTDQTLTYFAGSCKQSLRLFFRRIVIK